MLNYIKDIVEIHLPYNAKFISIFDICMYSGYMWLEWVCWCLWPGFATTEAYTLVLLLHNKQLMAAEQINREDRAHMEQGGKIVYMFSWIFLLYQKDGTEWLWRKLIGRLFFFLLSNMFKPDGQIPPGTTKSLLWFWGAYYVTIPPHCLSNTSQTFYLKCK